MAVAAETEEDKIVNSSLLTAFSYLLSHLEREFDQNTLHQHLADLEAGEDQWLILGLLDPKVQIVETGGYGTWPTKPNSVIHFKIQDPDEPMIEVDGNLVINETDYYCFVSDAGDRQVIDSISGVIRNGNMYGNPLEWASFEVGDPALTKKKKVKNDTYKVLSGGESGWQIASKLGIEPKTLFDHNNIQQKDAGKIAAGTILHLPYKSKTVIKRKVEIELLERPKKMHIVKEGGTKKLAYGNARSLKDVATTGPLYPQNKNVMIVAIARVPLQDEGQDVTAAYLMESLALGDYAQSGRVAWDIGFNHSHLEEGHVEETKPAPRPEVQAQLQEAAVAKDAADKRADLLAEAESNPNIWRTTYRAFEDGPRPYVTDTDMIITNHENGRQRTVPRLKGLEITGTFEKPDEEGNIVLYGRPTRGENSFHWYGVPMDLLTHEDDLYSTAKPNLPERVIQKGRLSFTERFISVPLSKQLNHPLIKRHVEKLKIKI
jgi:hypothetical protein